MFSDKVREPFSPRIFFFKTTSSTQRHTNTACPPVREGSRTRVLLHSPVRISPIVILSFVLSYPTVSASPHKQKNIRAVSSSVARRFPKGTPPPLGRSRPYVTNSFLPAQTWPGSPLSVRLSSPPNTPHTTQCGEHRVPQQTTQSWESATSGI